MNSINLFLRVLESVKSTVKVLADLVAGEHLLVWYLNVSSHGRKGKRSSLGSFHKGINPLHEGLCLHDLLPYQRPSPPNTIILRICFNIQIWRGHKYSIYSKL